MDSIYQSFRTHPSNTAGLDIRLFLSGIVVACDSAAAKWSHNSGDSFSDGIDFASWQRLQKQQYNFKYDIAMGISGKMKFDDLGKCIIWSAKRELLMILNCLKGKIGRVLEGLLPYLYHG
ncbi:hypothetical protein CHS0354_041073 [Potamilus streckersoni]|uniref:Uncharacterized protein n=1 Tax=Potamilus streckersoni TaxID=2493646 RepID=A0AAE0SDG5_9BIVA|nr:hypothetical protein CHS0354_041073 [Potamilus streckersoni]